MAGSLVALTLSNFEVWVRVLAALLQAGVALILGVIAVLTYRRARVGVLQPLRTEAYKLQLERAIQLLDYFGRKDNETFHRDIGLEWLARLAAIRCYLEDRVRRGLRDDEVYQIFVDNRVGMIAPMNQMYEAESFNFSAPSELVHQESKPVTYAFMDGVDMPLASIEWFKRMQNLTVEPLLPIEVQTAIMDYFKAGMTMMDTIPSIRDEIKKRLVRSADEDKVDLEAISTTVHTLMLRNGPRLDDHARNVVSAIIETLGVHAHEDLRHR